MSSFLCDTTMVKEYRVKGYVCVVRLQCGETKKIYDTNLASLSLSTCFFSTRPLTVWFFPPEWCHWKKRQLGPSSIKTMWAPKGTHELSKTSLTAVDRFSFGPCWFRIKDSLTLGARVCIWLRNCGYKSRQWQQHDAQWSGVTSLVRYCALKTNYICLHPIFV